ncbi:MAG: hypothetical protein BroJett026_34700 [Betaproteobacteria bacterium]|nr:MAG: hypothetical protein BroJett026_34700 [Betaproteobacteria bacterium]
MRSLCGAHTLIAPDDLIKREAQMLYGTPYEQLPPLMRDDGNWLPSHIEELEFPTRKQLVREMLVGMPRDHRRRVKRSLFTPTGELSERASRLLSVFAIPFAEQVSRRYPLTQRAREHVIGYVRGTFGGSKAAQEVLTSIRDLEVLSTWLQVNWTEVSPLTSYIRDMAEGLTERLTETAAELKRLRSAQGDTVLPQKHVADIHKAAYDQARNDFPLEMARRMLNADALPHRARLDMAPSLRVAGNILFAIGLSASLPTNARPLKSSDPIDALHALYLPHVDLFRADAFMADLIKKVAPEFASGVVSSLHALPSSIQARMEA